LMESSLDEVGSGTCTRLERVTLLVTHFVMPFGAGSHSTDSNPLQAQSPFQPRQNESYPLSRQEGT
jgi:hypothetical protein